MKYALITGGSRGIGRAVCLKLASMDYNVIINYVSNLKEAEYTLEMIHQQGGSGELLCFDVSNGEETRAKLEEWQSAHPNEYVEVLINNAGVRKDNLLVWMEATDWHQVLNVTLNGFYNVTQLLLKDMLVRKYGRIVNMASISGLKGIQGQVNYSAAKGGLIAATKALAQEVAKKGITVNAVAPGFIRTDMLEGLDEDVLKKQIPAGRLGDPEEVANLVGFLAAKESAYITGEVITISGGLST